ncbi:flagellar hook-basal body complex protein FliE [Clostridium vincentii]|uniref:Flagellar hook-basal body complex protein FliE n=1 Tax=Clostridium vincentii TaxID=52704 RepID=A0A2T0B6D0_9CLOT|nr:flagellar hook-basal body complex protein FliE [Clostridium vincentii]PRR79436.1 Flagellar hook-basal body complex protein FliE [Clostridium vincentii]
MIINNFVPSQEIFQKGINNIDTNKNNTVSTGLDTFATTLQNSIEGINDKQLVADKASEAFVKGEDVEISDVMLATEEAKVSLQFAVQVRNKLVDAYKEISQMQL